MRRLPVLLAGVAILAACTKPLDRDLGRALIGGDVEQARRLVKEGADINAPQSVRYGEPILVRLAVLPSASGVKTAIELGADPNRGDFVGRTALMVAAAANRTEAMRLLIDAGADVNLEAAAGRTALGAAKAEGSTEAIALLVAAGARDAEPKALYP
ncbi:MAG TPA: ankyrin repeat domain-containing protein [Candidatus Polarisedimenticolaceae bacterium]